MATLTNFDSYMHVLHEMSILTPQRPLDPAVCGAFADWLDEDGAEWLAVDPSLASDLRAGRCRFPWVDVNDERKVRGYVVVVNVDGSAGSVRVVSNRKGWASDQVEMGRAEGQMLYTRMWIGNYRRFDSRPAEVPIDPAEFAQLDTPFTFVDESGREFNASFAIPPELRRGFEIAPGRLVESSWDEPPQNVQGAISNLRERLAQIRSMSREVESPPAPVAVGEVVARSISEIAVRVNDASIDSVQRGGPRLTLIDVRRDGDRLIGILGPAVPPSVSWGTSAPDPARDLRQAVERAREGGRLIRQEYFRRHGIDVATLFRPDGDFGPSPIRTEYVTFFPADAPAQPYHLPATEDDSEGGSPD